MNLMLFFFFFIKINIRIFITVLRCVLCANAYNAHPIFEVRSGGKSLVPIYNTGYFRGIGFIVTSTETISVVL